MDGNGNEHENKGSANEDMEGNEKSEDNRVVVLWLHNCRTYSLPRLSFVLLCSQLPSEIWCDCGQCHLPRAWERYQSCRH